MILLHAESFQKHVRVFEKTRTTLGKTRTCFRNLVIMFL